MFYNPKRKHTNNGMLSPPPLIDCLAIDCRAMVDFEIRQQKLNEAGV
jgi:putative transposase